MSTVEAEVIGRLRPRLLGLEQQLPHVFVLRAEQPLQGPGTGRVELSNGLLTRPTGEYPAEEHHLNHAGEAGIFIYHALDALLQHRYLVRRRLVQALVELGCQP